jgi:hypothetical protein
VAVVAVAGDDLVALADGKLHPDDHSFLADIEVAEAADQPHSVHLPRLFFETADQQHPAVGVELFFAGKLGRTSRMRLFRTGCVRRRG